MLAPNHQKRAHALLSASGASRWMACTPSARLEEDFKDESSDFAKEGTLAHEFADFALRMHNDEITKGRYEEATKELKKNKFYSKEMPAEVDKYVTFVLEELAEYRRTTPDAKLIIEKRFDFSHVVPEGFGTGDTTIVADTVLHVIDLKYGKGVRVNADANPQLILYGSGALAEYCLLYDIKVVRLTIMQPRLNHISTWDISVEDLKKWEDNTREVAKIAFAGDGPQVVGDHCRWCKAKPRCRAFGEMINGLAAKDFTKPELLSLEEVVEVYEKAPLVASWVKSVGSYLLKIALEGEEIEGYKLVEGTSRRKWTDEIDVIETLRLEGFAVDEITSSKVLGIGDISSLMSKDDFEKEMHHLVLKPAGKPTLVPESDSRPAMGNAQAIKDFS